MTALAANGGRTALVSVFAATCTGLARLSNEVGITLVHVEAGRDVREIVRRLNATCYGSGYRSDAFASPLGFERCWDDWDVVPIDPCDRSTANALGIRFANGRIEVPLPRGTTLAEFGAELRGALRHLRLHEVAMRPAFLEARAEAMADNAVIAPRYAPRRPVDGVRMPDFRGASLCDAIYALDPTDAAGACRLFWLTVSARLAAGEGRRPTWR